METTRTMTWDEETVWNCLKHHIGRENAIQRATLVASTALCDRIVRSCVETLRKDHGKLICYATDRPGGYFLAQSIEDLKACRNLEASREAHVRENRQFYDQALSAAGDKQVAMEL